jgi:hypothetical protein
MKASALSNTDSIILIRRMSFGWDFQHFANEEHEEHEEHATLSPQWFECMTCCGPVCCCSVSRRNFVSSGTKYSQVEMVEIDLCDELDGVASEVQFQIALQDINVAIRRGCLVACIGPTKL